MLISIIQLNKYIITLHNKNRLYNTAIQCLYEPRNDTISESGMFATRVE